MAFEIMAEGPAYPAKRDKRGPVCSHSATAVEEISGINSPTALVSLSASPLSLWFSMKLQLVTFQPSPMVALCNDAVAR